MVLSCAGSEHLATTRIDVGNEDDVSKLIFMFENVSMSGKCDTISIVKSHPLNPVSYSP